MKPELTVVIVGYQSAKDAQKAVESAQRQAGVSAEIVVVDNGGAPVVRDGVRLISNGRNLGWGPAVHQAADASAAPILVLLNPDCELKPGALAAVRDAFRDEANARVGVIGGRLFFDDGAPQPSCGPFPDLSHLVTRLILPPARRRYYLREPRTAGTVDWVTGAFMAVRRAAWEQLGGLDPGFFLYYEDVDLCRRAWNAGWQVLYIPEAQAVHSKPYAVRRSTASAELKKIIQNSRLRYFRKHRPEWETRALEALQRWEPIG